MLHMIINPVAGNGRAAQIGAQCAQYLADRGVDCIVTRTEYAGHATALAQAAAAAGAQTVVSVGGDGTVLEVMRGIYGTQAALGIVPAGTGNDVVKMLSTPRKPLEALDFIIAHPARRMDVGRINELLFLNVAGTGFDVAVLDNAMSAKRFVRGMLPYLWGVIRTIFTYKPKLLEISVDGEAPIRKELLLVAVGNGRFIGGGMNVTPDAVPDDGLFDIIMIDNMPRWKLPPKLVLLLTGRVKEIPGTVYRKCRGVSIAAPGMRVNIDGEIVPMDRVAMEIIPGALMAHW